jgi:ABC-2 type transport system ATP-binding protein
LEGVTLIELKSVSGTFGKGAVKDVSFRLPNGKTYGVFSPRYADAVCLLSLMSGARTPLGGTVLAGGFDLHREPKKARRGIGFLSADLLPDSELTPIEYFMSVADARELSYDKTLRYAHELLELADLIDKKDRLIANLSQGEGRILCLLQTLLGKPEILILTSPFSGLTQKDAQKMRDLIDYFGDTYTIFLCTPVAKELCGACDEILVLEDGTLKSVIPADADAIAAMQSAAPVKDATAPEEPQKRKRSRWAMLTEKSGAFEVLESDEKEGKN